MSTPTSDSSGPGASGPSSPGASDRFFAWLRGLGIVRGNDRWFAGVAGGLAAKAGIDPLIVRGIFVVLAVLGGPGILLYLAGWALLPDARGVIHLEEVFRGRASGGTITAVIVLGTLVVIPAIVMVFRGIFGMPWGWLLPDWLSVTLGIIWWAVLLPAAIIWFIIWVSGGMRPSKSAPGASSPTAAHSATTSQTFAAPHAASGPQQPSTAPPAGAAAPPGGGFADSNFSGSARERNSDWGEQIGQKAGEWGEQVGQKAGEWGEQVGQKAGEWGEQVGAKAEQWGEQINEKSREWEHRHREYQAAHRPSAGFVVMSLALALIAGGFAAAAALGIGLSNNAILTAGLTVAVVVLALAMIVAGIRGRDSGWVGFFAFIGAVALAFAPFSTVLPEHTRVVPFGNVVESPQSDVDSAVLMVAGDATIDLADIRPGETPGDFELWLLGGDATVEIPRWLPAQVQVEMLGGNIREDLKGELIQHSGAFLSRTVTANFDNANPDDAATVNVRVLGGRVTIQETNR